MAKQHGIALVVVLWMLALMTIIALSYSNMTRTESLLNSNTVYAAQARAEAESGIWIAVHDLLNPIKNRRFYPDGLPNLLHETSKQHLIISVQDESGKVDLNKASQQLLLSMIISTEIDFDQANQIVDAILDWRDKDHLSRVNGAEDSDYKSNGYPYRAKDGAFNSIGELQQIHGVEASLYKKLQPLITVHSMQSRIRLNSAPLGVLNALPDMSEDLSTQIMTRRSNNGGTLVPIQLPATAKPLVFTSGQGKVFSIISEAKINGVIARLKVVMTLKKSNIEPITILDWQENVPPLSMTAQNEILSDTTPENALEL